MTKVEQARARIRQMTDAQLEEFLRKCDQVETVPEYRRGAAKHFRTATGSGANMNARLAKASEDLRRELQAEKDRRK
jgi:hypothetical protein